MKERLFVIMPISACVDASEKSEIISKVSRENNWTARLPSYDPNRPVFTLNETVEQLMQSHLVFADLSDERPSCYFELGLAEALHRPIFPVARTGTKIHQTSFRNEVLYYDTLSQFSKLVSQALNQ